MTLKLFIDPGHGGTDPGAVGNGLKEKDLTLAIALETRRVLLNEYEGVQVRMSREKDQTVSLKARTDAANAWNATFFLSIHINAGGGTGFESFRYVEKGSAMTMNTQKHVHAEVQKALGLRDRGQKWANFHVLRESKMPAMLTECGFIDNKTDAAKLKDASILKKLGRAHAVGIAKAFGLKKKAAQPAPKPDPKPAPTPTPKTDNLIRVKVDGKQVGAFSVPDNAVNVVKQHVKAGMTIEMK